MNKKVLLLIGICILGLGFIEIQAVSLAKAPCYEFNDDVNVPSGFDKIDLRGSLMNGIGPNAIVAGASDNAVYVGFNQDFGNVSISIYNEAGLVVYSTVVNTSVQQVVIIPFSSAASGTYTVELNSANGYVDGDFEHD